MDSVYQKFYDEGYRVISGAFPEYSKVKAILPIWEGYKKDDIKKMMDDIHDLSGTPQDTVDWSEPNKWIEERLEGKSKELALKTWKDSGETINPRYAWFIDQFIKKFSLLEENSDTGLLITDRGKAFIENDKNHLSLIDELEGLPKLLSIIAEKGQVKRGDILEDWTEYLKNYSKFGTVNTIKHTLRARLKNLLDRNLIERNGNFYTITEQGSKKAIKINRTTDNSKHQAIKAIKFHNEQQKDILLDRLMKIKPYEFEKFVGQLLDALDYQDVEVTRQSQDKGIDVKGKALFGITEITEVIQVKKTKSSIGRPVLDKLRGAAQLEGALKGTIITLGKFSKECKEYALHPGATPVTLIDGDRLFEILKENEIGIQKSKQTLINIDEEFLEKFLNEGIEEN